MNFTNANCVITLASEGNYIWAGTVGGVVKWNISNGEYIKLTSADGLVDNVVLSIAIDSEGNKWFGTSEGISRFDDTNWTSYTTNGNAVYSIAIDSEGVIWFGKEKGVSSYDGVSWTEYDKSDGLANDYVSSIAIDSEGNKWFAYGFDGKGATKFDGTNWTTYAESDGLACDYVFSITTDSEGNICFGVENPGDKYEHRSRYEISKFDGTNWTTYTYGLIDYASSTTTDSEGNIWLDTN